MPEEDGWQRTARVAGLDAERLRLVEIDRHLERRFHDGQVDHGVGDAVDLADGVTNPGGLRAELVEAVPEGADRDVHVVHAIGVVEDVVDAVATVGQDRRRDARVAADHRFDRVDSSSVVHFVVEVHPDLAGVHTDRLIAEDGSPDVTADVGDAGSSFSSSSILEVIRVISCSDVPGAASEWTSRSRRAARG